MYKKTIGLLRARKLDSVGVAHHALLALVVVAAVAGFGAYRVLYSSATTQQNNNWAEQKQECRDTYNAQAKQQKCIDEVEQRKADYQAARAKEIDAAKKQCDEQNRLWNSDKEQCGGCKKGFYDKSGTCTARVAKDCAAENRRQLDEYTCGQCLSGYYDTDSSENGVSCKEIENQSEDAIDPATATRQECLNANRVWKNGQCGDCKEGFVEKRGACKQKTSSDDSVAPVEDPVTTDQPGAQVADDSGYLPGSVTGTKTLSEEECKALNRIYNKKTGACNQCQRGFYDGDKTTVVDCRSIVNNTANAIDVTTATEEECVAANRVWIDGACGDCKEGFVEKRGACREKLTETEEAEAEAADNETNPAPDANATTLDELEAQAIEGNFRIVVYTKKNFEGDKKIFNRPVADLGDLNDKISSFKITKGRWQLCEDANFQKNCTKTYASAADLSAGKNDLNDKISSLRPVTQLRFEEAEEDVVPVCTATTGEAVASNEDGLCPQQTDLACPAGFEIKNLECKEATFQADVIRTVDKTFRGEGGEKKCLLLGREWIAKPGNKEINGGEYGCSEVTCNLKQDGAPIRGKYCVSNRYDAPYAEKMSQKNCEQNLHRVYIDQVGMCAMRPNRKDKDQTKVGAEQCKGSYSVYYTYRAAERNDTCYKPGFFQTAQEVVQATGGALGAALQTGPRIYCGVVKGGAFHWNNSKNACVKDPVYYTCWNGAKVLNLNNCPALPNPGGGDDDQDITPPGGVEKAYCDERNRRYNAAERKCYDGQSGCKSGFPVYQNGRCVKGDLTPGRTIRYITCSLFNTVIGVEKLGGTMHCPRYQIEYIPGGNDNVPQCNRGTSIRGDVRYEHPHANIAYIVSGVCR